MNKIKNTEAIVSAIVRNLMSVALTAGLLFTVSCTADDNDTPYISGTHIPVIKREAEGSGSWIAPNGSASAKGEMEGVGFTASASWRGHYSGSNGSNPTGSIYFYVTFDNTGGVYHTSLGADSTSWNLQYPISNKTASVSTSLGTIAFTLNATNENGEITFNP